MLTCSFTSAQQRFDAAGKRDEMFALHWRCARVLVRTVVVRKRCIALGCVTRRPRWFRNFRWCLVQMSCDAIALHNYHFYEAPTELRGRWAANHGSIIKVFFSTIRPSIRIVCFHSVGAGEVGEVAAAVT